MLTTVAAQLDQAVRAVCPILGVSIGDPNSPQTWSVQFDPSATAGQQAAAVNVVATFVPVPATPAAPAANTDKLVTLLQSKGVITAQDATTLFQASKIPT